VQLAVTCILFLAAVFFGSNALAVVCAVTLGSEERYKHIFVGRITEARATDWAESTDSYVGVVRAPLEVEESIKGNPESVPYLYYRLHDRGSAAADAGPPTMPVGYSLVIYAKDDGPLEFSTCSTFFKIHPATRECRIYDVRRRVGVSEKVNEKCESEFSLSMEQRKRNADRRRARRDAERMRQEKTKRIVEEAGYSYSDLTPLG